MTALNILHLPFAVVPESVFARPGESDVLLLDKLQYFHKFFCSTTMPFCFLICFIESAHMLFYKIRAGDAAYASYLINLHLQVGDESELTLFLALTVFQNSTSLLFSEIFPHLFYTLLQFRFQNRNTKDTPVFAVI